MYNNLLMEDTNELFACNKYRHVFLVWLTL